MESISVLINSSRPLPRDEQEWTRLTDLTYEAKEESQRRQRSWKKHCNKEFESSNIHRMQHLLHAASGPGLYQPDVDPGLCPDMATLISI
ncbi:hypothetical protein Tco_0546178 [Tanacetum coccineum]